MSYLDPISIIFSGDFRSDVSTINNDVRHYNNKTFEKRFQDAPEIVTNPDGKRAEIQNGWWNPNGGATFNFLNCHVTRCILPGGIESDDKRIIGSMVTDSNNRSPGKMVDLDPQMQFTSELWGVHIRLTNLDGDLLFSGDLDSTGFRDAQQRQFPTSQDDQEYIVNGQPLGGNWVTTINNVVWGNIEEIDAIKSLKKSTEGNRLSISLSAFGYFYEHRMGRFSMGRIIGAIGPWNLKDPTRFAPTRRLYGTIVDVLQYTNFIINEDLLTIDFGMSFPIQDPLGTPHLNFSSFVVAVSKGLLDIPISSTDPVILDPANYLVLENISIPKDPQWLLQTGGIVQMKIKGDAKNLVSSHQILLLREMAGKLIVYARESIEGWYVRADQNVLRIDPGETKESVFYVYQWGKPVENVSINIELQPRQSGGGGGRKTDPNPPKAKIPEINFPSEAVTLASDLKTDRFGINLVRFTGADPRNPREYLDGQIYLFDYSISGNTGKEKYFNDTIMVHLRNAFPVPENPSWEDVKEIFIQFGNLYPIMSKHVVDMHIIEDILSKKDILLFAFNRDINDPLYMPVTRDLSASKIETIVKWLKKPTVESKKSKMIQIGNDVQENNLQSESESMLSTASRAKGGDLSAFARLFNKTPLELL